MSPIISRSGSFVSGVGFGRRRVSLSAPSTYSISPSTTSVNEGSSVTFTVNTTNVADSTTLYWTLSTISGTINTSDFSGGATSGSFTITTNTGSVTLTLSNDSATEGSESFQFQVRTDSTSGTVVATSSTITINDTSISQGLLDSTTFTGIRNYFAARLSNYRNPSFYSYTLDSSPGQISDGGGDMYDGGNCVSLLESGSQVAGGCLDYNVSNSTGGNLRFGSMGYTHPLFCMATSGNTQRRFGWSSNGNLGADGGGSSGSATVYNTQTVNGCIVHSWLVRKAFNAGDPSVNHLFVTLGHSSLGSQINSIDVQSFNSSTDSDVSQYETTSVNCLVMRILLSKSGGTTVNVGECQTVVQNLANDFNAHFGL